MFGHFPELIIVLVLALIFFGPEKLPEIAGSAGKMVGELRAAMDAAMHPDTEIADDEFATYYYDSVHRSGETDVELDDLPDPGDDVDLSMTDDEEYDHDAFRFTPEHDVEDAWETESGAHPLEANGAAEVSRAEVRDHGESE
jgi:TatA/E family protein of Tat protein translocase